MELVEPLYYGRVASFVNQSKNMDSRQAEELVEEQARSFEVQKDYLVEMWEEKEREEEANGTQDEKIPLYL